MIGCAVGLVWETFDGENCAYIAILTLACGREQNFVKYCMFFKGQ